MGGQALVLDEVVEGWAIGCRFVGYGRVIYGDVFGFLPHGERGVRDVPCAFEEVERGYVGLWF